MPLHTIIPIIDHWSLVVTAHGHYCTGSSLSFIICWKFSWSSLSLINTAAVSLHDHPFHCPHQCMVMAIPLSPTLSFTLIIPTIGYTDKWDMVIPYRPSLLIVTPIIYHWPSPHMVIPLIGWPFTWSSRYWPSLHMVILIIGHPCTQSSYSLAIPIINHPFTWSFLCTHGHPYHKPSCHMVIHIMSNF